MLRKFNKSLISNTSKTHQSLGPGGARVNLLTKKSKNEIGKMTYVLSETEMRGSESFGKKTRFTQL